MAGNSQCGGDQFISGKISVLNSEGPPRIMNNKQVQVLFIAHISAGTLPTEQET